MAAGKKFDHNVRKGTFDDIALNDRLQRAESLREAWSKLEIFEKKSTRERGNGFSECILSTDSKLHSDVAGLAG